jgi:hypothetical protein
MLSPEIGALGLSRSSPNLRAEAPLQWAEYPAFVSPDPSYHANNKVQYRWTLTNLSDGSHPPVTVEQAQLVFHPTDGAHDLPWLEYNQPLAGLVVGDTYRVTLRVRDAGNPATGHEVSRDLVINP